MHVKGKESRPALDATQVPICTHPYIRSLVATSDEYHLARHVRRLDESWEKMFRARLRQRALETCTGSRSGRRGKVKSVVGLDETRGICYLTVCIRLLLPPSNCRAKPCRIFPSETASCTTFLASRNVHIPRSRDIYRHSNNAQGSRSLSARKCENQS